MYNKVILVGNLTRDVELRYTQGGLAIAKVGLATNRKYKGQDGEQKEEVCFIDVNIFGRTAEVANQYLKKGSKVLIEGRLVLEQWNDQSGQKRSKHSVTAESMQMLDTKGGGGSSGGYGSDDSYSGSDDPYASDAAGSKESRGAQKAPMSYPIDEDEIPF